MRGCHQFTLEARLSLNKEEFFPIFSTIVLAPFSIKSWVIFLCLYLIEPPSGVPP